MTDGALVLNWFTQFMIQHGYYRVTIKPFNTGVVVRNAAPRINPSALTV